jgi:DNA invertase Pin-like site-specific DNA recombinase
MRAITYARVATTDQQGGGSLDAQERACLDFAQTRAWVLVESIRVVASGLSLGRPGIERAGRLLRDGAADVLVTGALDRLGRDPQKLAALVDEIEHVGARLEVVAEGLQDPAVRRLALSLRAYAVAAEQLERQRRPTGVGRCA